MNLSIKNIQSLFVRKGYHFYEKGAYNLNIIGIRSSSSASNRFDDMLLVIYREERGLWRTDQFPITTDPGKPYLLKPLNPEGTAILVPGQYLNAYKIGIHGRSKPADRQYMALEQVKQMKYVRDNNRDAVVNVDLYKDPKNIFSANLKSNIHRGNSGWLSTLKQEHLVDGHSAACQVFQYRDQFDYFMDLCQKSAANWFNAFTYTLLEEKDLSAPVVSMALGK